MGDDAKTREKEAEREAQKTRDRQEREAQERKAAERARKGNPYREGG